MAGMAPMVTRMVVDGLISRPPSALVPRKSEVALCSLSVFAAVAASIFGLLAFYYYMLELALTPALAALSTAGLALAVSLVSCSVLAMMRQEQRRRAAAKPAVSSLLPAGMDEMLGAVTDELEDVIAKNPATATALSALAGFVIAEKMHS